MSPNRDKTLMGVAQLWSEHATCSRLAVGAVISRDGRSFSTGYNGAPKGLRHCDHRLCSCRHPTYKLGSDPLCKKHGTCLTAVHAELNAIAFAARHGLATLGAELHSTHQPCLNCAMAIINAGIMRVVFLHPYRDSAGLDLLKAAGVTTQIGV